MVRPGLDPQARSCSNAARPEFRVRVFPNPAHGSVTASFAGPREGPVRVDVYDVTGRPVGAARVRETGPGTGIAEWDARDAAGRQVPPGVYFLRGIAPDGARATARVVLR